MADLPQVYGNYVDGIAIAGLITLSQLNLLQGSGVIDSLSFDGSITLVGGAVIRINDPNAVYSAGYKLHPEFTADDENPSITGMYSFSNFPK
jgi:hypothetical protein